MYKQAQQVTDMDGEKIKVGDKVQCFSLYDDKPLNIVEVSEIWNQGRNGSIIKSKTAPDPEYPYSFTHKAKKTKKWINSLTPCTKKK